MKDRNPITRRRALASAVGLGAVALPLPALAGQVEDSGKSSVAPKLQARNMRVSLAAYSVRDALNSGQIDLFDLIDWCGSMNLSGIELTSYYFKKGFDREYLQQLRQRAFRQGLTVSGTAVGNNFCLPPGKERAKEVSQVEQWIDHAADLFAPHIRIFAGSLPEGVEKKTGIQWVADSIKKALEKASQRGVMLGLENHGGITARAADHLAICDAVGEHPWFGINLDTGNYRTNPYEELALAATQAVNVQVKVEIYKGEEKIPADLKRLRDILIKANYKGWVALEYEAAEDPRVAIPRHASRLKELFES